MSDQTLSVLLALCAAALFAAGTVLQGRAAESESDEAALKAGFLLRLLRRPQWLGGIAVDALGFVAQAAALGIGRLVVVQPLLATTVVFALPLSAWLADKKVTRREIVAALAVTVGISVFLIIGEPSAGRDDAPVGDWLIAGAILLGVTAVLVVIGARSGPGARAALFGTACGILFAVSAGLTKAVVDQLGEGVLTIFTDWHIYALIVVGVASMALSQTSLQTGRFAPAIATSVTFDPVASLLLGLTLFTERLEESPAAIAASIVSLLVMFWGLYVLAATSPEAEAEPQQG